MSIPPAAGGRVSLVTILVLLVAALTAIDLVLVFQREHRIRYQSAVIFACLIAVAVAAQRSRP